jgi:hypothetical protein
MVPLGKNFMISGLEEKDEPLKFAGLLSGKSEDEIADYIAAEKVRIANLPKPPPPIYHTDEEYQQLAIQREKLGLHYMDRTYTEEKLEELLTPGMILAEVTGIFGKANRVSRKDNGDWELTFETASEKFPIEEEFHLNSFNTLFSDGKLVSWNPYGSSKQTRTPKPPQSKPQPTNLEITVPPADMSSEDFDFITFVEEYKISLKPGKTQPTKSDALTLANLLFSVCSGSEKDQTIASQCDLISILAKKIPEVAAFVKNSKGGKIPTKALGKALEPYIFAGKALK